MLIFEIVCQVQIFITKYPLKTTKLSNFIFVVNFVVPTHRSAIVYFPVISFISFSTLNYKE